MATSCKNISHTHIRLLFTFIILFGISIIFLLYFIATSKKDSFHAGHQLISIRKQLVRREYMNPIQAILDLNEWNVEFLEEINLNGTLGTNVSHSPMYVEFPEALNQMKFPKIVNKSHNINCEKLFRADPYHLIQVEKLILEEKDPSPFVKRHALMKTVKNCTRFIKDHGYIMANISKSEEDFPIAYSIVVYKNISQVEHLLRAIYRPQNMYCIHVDRKSNKFFKNAAWLMAACFDNVFITLKSTTVHWGDYTILEADLNCLEELWRKRQKSTRKWKYVINLTGQEFPLKTNWEIVQILKAGEGAVWVGATINNTWAQRWESSFTFNSDTYKTRIGAKGPPPHPYKMAKGPVHAALPYYFVNFTLNDKIAIDLRNWLRDTELPEETFFATLVSSKHLGVPGAYTGAYNYHPNDFGPVRFKKWYYERLCRGEEQREICLLGIWDLPELKIRPELFANKFRADYHPEAYMCLEELHWNKTREEMFLFGRGMEPHFDTSPYQYLPWIRHSQKMESSGIAYY